MQLKNKTLQNSAEVADPSNSKTSKIQTSQTKRKKQVKKDEEGEIQDEKEDVLHLRCLKTLLKQCSRSRVERLSRPIFMLRF